MPKNLETFSETYKKALPQQTYSLCPTCLKKIPARVFEKSGKVLIEKTCKEHGKTTEVYFSDIKMYERFRKYGHTDSGVSNPNTKSTGNCPFDCGLCSNHKSHTALLNLAVTNRCDLKCWYCFYYAKEGYKIYEPSLEKIKEMLKTARAEKPVAPVAIQLTGGNPELRDDLPEIIKACKDAGFSQIQLNT
ncbi:MAG: radical SAM protein [Candidatus Aenigmatarchaeota archaeon]